MYVSDNLDAFDSYEREKKRHMRRYPEYYEVEKENDDLPEHLVDIEWENDFAEKDGVIDGLEIKEDKLNGDLCSNSKYHE